MHAVHSPVTKTTQLQQNLQIRCKVMQHLVMRYSQEYVHVANHITCL